MSEIEAHIDQTEFVNTLAINDRRSMINALSALAEKGNIHAANLYGDFLVQGIWDEEKMTLDLVSGKLWPIPADPKYDPYLILPRDVPKALFFYRFASSNTNFDHCPAFNSAKAKLEYCHRSGLAGFNANPLIPKSNIDQYTKNLLDNNAKNALADSSGQFLSLPDKRPEIMNPLNEIFSHFGRVQRDRTVLQIFIGLFIITLFKIVLVEFRIYLAYISGFIIPLCLCAYAFHKFGFYGKMPMCSCSAMRKAYAKKLETLPEECRNQQDPFATHNIFIRNFALVKRIWLWSIILSFFAYLLYLFKTERSSSFLWSLDFFLNFLLATILSSSFIAWDMKVPGIIAEIGKSRFIFTIFIGFVFFFFFDNDCCNELERENKPTDFQLVIDKQIEEAIVVSSNIAN